MYKQENYLLQVAYSKPVRLYSNSDKMWNLVSGKDNGINFILLFASHQWQQ